MFRFRHLSSVRSKSGLYIYAEKQCCAAILRPKRHSVFVGEVQPSLKAKVDSRTLQASQNIFVLSHGRRVSTDPYTSCSCQGFISLSSLPKVWASKCFTPDRISTPGMQRSFSSFQTKHKTLSRLAWKRNHQNQTDRPRGSFVVAAALVFGGLYMLWKWHHSSRKSVCQAERLSDDEQKGEIKSPDQSHCKRLSLQEAIAQASDLCQRMKDESGSPGLAIAVSVDGQPVWAQGFGYADVENRLPCTPDTVMRIASISKSITMAAVAKAMERGELDLDKPVQFYVPKFPDKVIDGEKVTITTRQLLSHLGGIRHYSKKYMKDKKMEKSAEKSTSAKPTSDEQKKPPEDQELPGEFSQMEYFLKDKFESTKAAMALFENDPLVHKPGTKWLYTTHGWTLVAAVLEGATKKKFPDLIRTLFHDLGLEETYLDENGPLIYNRARFYTRNKKGKLVNSPYVDCSYKFAGGGMLSTVTDLNRFASAMLYSYQFRDMEKSTTAQQQGEPTQLPGYLKHSTMEQLWSPVELASSVWDRDGFYGMGWAVIPGKQTIGGGRQRRFYVSHTGGAIGASSVLLILPARGDGADKGSKPDSLLPKGVCVAMFVNMVHVCLNKAALDIAKLFEQVSRE